MVTIPVLVVGAGPSGLNLSLQLARRGVRHRVISDAKGPGEQSRAMVVQARTLEFYGQLGFGDEVVSQGIIAERAHVRRGGKDGRGHEVLTFTFKDLGQGLSPYPFALTYPQDDHERFLLNKLKEVGIEVEWGAKLTGFTQDAHGIKASIERGDGRTEEAEADYICGCDGARSCVRETLKVGFPGGTYSQLFYVADVKISRGFDRDAEFNLGENILSLMFPVRRNGTQRLIGLVPPELSDSYTPGNAAATAGDSISAFRRGRDCQAGHDLTFEDIRGEIETLLDIEVTQVNWFSTYRVHHRVAGQFRVGRAFLCGDAGHIHSPAGGQGMNTGIGDAVNLGWKLADVARGRADASVLDTYEPERIGFARSLVATTDRAFTGMVKEGLAGEFVRRFLAPMVFGVATRFNATRHAMFRLVSQTRIHYPDSALSEGIAGEVHGGDRLPWTGAGGEDNFAVLRCLDWQAHVYGDVRPEFEEACRELELPLQRFAWSDGARDVGIRQDAVYLVRPDGYVGLASAEQDVTQLRVYVERFGLQFDRGEN